MKEKTKETRPTEDLSRGSAADSKLKERKQSLLVDGKSWDRVGVVNQDRKGAGRTDPYSVKSKKNQETKSTASTLFIIQP